MYFLSSFFLYYRSKLRLFFVTITGLLDDYLKCYDDFVIVGDFNANESNPAMENFLNEHKCKIYLRVKHAITHRTVLV